MPTCLVEGLLAAIGLKIALPLPDFNSAAIEKHEGLLIAPSVHGLVNYTSFRQVDRLPIAAIVRNYFDKFSGIGNYCTPAALRPTLGHLRQAFF